MTEMTEMTKLTDEHRRLHTLAGRWAGKERMHPSPFDAKGGPAMGLVENRIALDGLALVHDYQQERNGAVHFQGHGVFRWDAQEKLYVLYWFDSWGLAPNVFRGGFEGNVLTLVCHDSQGQTRIVYDLGQAGKYGFRMDICADGKTWLPFADGTYTRAEA